MEAVSVPDTLEYVGREELEFIGVEAEKLADLDYSRNEVRPVFSDLFSEFVEENSGSMRTPTEVVNFLTDDYNRNDVSEMGSFISTLDDAGIVEEWGGNRYIFDVSDEDLQILDSSCRAGYFENCLEFLIDGYEDMKLNCVAEKAVNANNGYWDFLQVDDSYREERFLSETADNGFLNYAKNANLVRTRSTDEGYRVRCTPEEVELARDALDFYLEEISGV